MAQLYRSVTYALSALLLAICANGVQAVPRHIPEDKWRALTNDKALWYKNQLEQAKVEESTQASKGLSILDTINRIITNETVQKVFWIIMGLLVVYGIYKLFLSEGMALFDKKSRKSANIAVDEPTDINDVNWERLLKEALQKNDMTQAVRFSYMWLLQLLQEGELIHYRDDKTNNDYYRELQNTAFKQPFRQLSRQYEYVVYGNYVPGEASFNQYIDLFNRVKTQLGR